MENSINIKQCVAKTDETAAFYVVFWIYLLYRAKLFQCRRQPHGEEKEYVCM
jgi:hypothetical protein